MAEYFEYDLLEAHGWPMVRPIGLCSVQYMDGTSETFREVKIRVKNHWT